MPSRPAPLVESTEILDDPEALRSRLAQHGYLFFRGLLDEGEVTTVRTDILHALAGVGWLAAGSDPADALPDDLIRVEADDNWWGGYQAIQKLESFHRLGHDDALVGITRKLLGEDDILVHPRKIARVTYPNNGVPTPPHQDYPYLQGASDVLTMWVPFGDASVEMGSLRILEGSHEIGLREPIRARGIGGLGVAADESDPNWRGADYRSGDVLVFFSFTVHWAPPNESNLMRLSADYRYQSAKEPVVDGSLGPHSRPMIPDWPELTVGWSTTKWIETPPGLDIVDIRMPDNTLTAPVSRFAPA